jgi:hypothetical protein
VIVYVWPAGGGNVGHASMLVDGGTPGGLLYLSWWPPKPNQKVTSLILTGGNRTKTYAEDCASEDGDPRGAVDFDEGVLNETAIKKWWNDKLAKGETYKLFSNNCSTAVAEALKVGGSDAYFAQEVKDGMRDAFISHNALWTPADVLRYAIWTKNKIARFNEGAAAEMLPVWEGEKPLNVGLVGKK